MPLKPLARLSVDGDFGGLWGKQGPQKKMLDEAGV